MQLLLTLLVYAVGLGLIVTGIWYQTHRQRLQSDPLLIKTCYLGGSVLLLGNLLATSL